MARPRNPRMSPQTSSLMVRLDKSSKNVLKKAADLRRISVSDYVRTVTLAQAQREVESARQQVISLTPAEQLAFWNALQKPQPLNPALRRLGRIMRGEE